MGTRTSRIEINVSLRNVKRSDLEYPTENVNFAYLNIIDKIALFPTVHLGEYYYAAVTKDYFADKAIGHCYLFIAGWTIARALDCHNFYYPDTGTSQYYNNYFLNVSIYYRVNDQDTRIAYAQSSIPPPSYADSIYSYFSLAGSSLKVKAWVRSFFDPLEIVYNTPDGSVTTTHTGIASGRFGRIFREDDIPEACYLFPTMSALPKPVAIVEVGVEGSGKYDDPFRPALDESYPVSWGGYEFMHDAPVNLVAIYGDVPGSPGAVEKQKEFARSKGLRVFSPPRDYSESVELYNRVKSEYPHWLAGKDNFAYQMLGSEVFELMQNADFYYGELLEHKTHYQQLKQVPDFEVRRRLNTIKEGLKKVSVITEERDKHLMKVGEILRVGW